MHFSHPTSASYATHLETGILLLPKATLFCTPLRVNKIFLWSMVQWLPPKILLFLLESLKKKKSDLSSALHTALKILDDSFHSFHKFPFPSTLPQQAPQQFFQHFLVHCALIPFTGQGAVRSTTPWAFEQEDRRQKNQSFNLASTL